MRQVFFLSVFTKKEIEIQSKWLKLCIVRAGVQRDACWHQSWESEFLLTISSSFAQLSIKCVLKKLFSVYVYNLVMWWWGKNTFENDCSYATNQRSIDFITAGRMLHNTGNNPLNISDKICATPNNLFHCVLWYFLFSLFYYARIFQNNDMNWFFLVRNSNGYNQTICANKQRQNNETCK